ncbi:MAG: hypothetical protein QXJ59_06475 [Thermofilaceae archaeon]
MRREGSRPPAGDSPAPAGAIGTATSAPGADAPAAPASQGQGVGVDIFSVRGTKVPVFLRVEVEAFKNKKMKFKVIAFKGLSLNQGRVMAIPSSSVKGKGFSFSFRRTLEEGTILILEIEERRGGCSIISRMFFMVNLEKRWLMKRDGMIFILENLQLSPSIELFYDKRRELAEEQLKKTYNATTTDMFSPALFALWKFFFPQFFEEKCFPSSPPSG